MLGSSLSRDQEHLSGLLVLKQLRRVDLQLKSLLLLQNLARCLTILHLLRSFSLNAQIPHLNAQVFEAALDSLVVKFDVSNNFL